MNNKEKSTLEASVAGFNAFLLFARNIGTMPLEQWQILLEKTEHLATTETETLREEAVRKVAQTIGRDKAALLKSLIVAALPLKEAILKSQSQAQKIVEDDLDRLADAKLC